MKSDNYSRDENMQPIVQCCIRCFFFKEDNFKIALFVYKGMSVCEKHLKELIEKDNV